MTQQIAITTFACALALTACGSEEGGADYAREQAAKARKDRAAGATVVEVKAPVPAGTEIPCEELVDLDEFNKYFEPEGKDDEPVRLVDESDKLKEREFNARCAIVRPGEPPSQEEQKKMLETQITLGVLPGEAWCYVHYGCSYITTEERFEKSCKGQRTSSNRDLGQFACVKTMVRGPKDAYNYKVFDRDTECVLEIRGGHAVTDEEIVQNCARAALEGLKPSSIAAHQQ